MSHHEFVERFESHFDNVDSVAYLIYCQRSDSFEVIHWPFVNEVVMSIISCWNGIQDVFSILESYDESSFIRYLHHFNSGWTRCVIHASQCSRNSRERLMRNLHYIFRILTSGWTRKQFVLSYFRNICKAWSHVRPSNFGAFSLEIYGLFVFFEFGFEPKFIFKSFDCDFVGEIRVLYRCSFEHFDELAKRLVFLVNRLILLCHINIE